MKGRLSDMKSREDVVAFIEEQFKWDHECSLEKGHQTHYGRQELRELLDFLYGGPPENEEQRLHKVDDL